MGTSKKFRKIALGTVAGVTLAGGLAFASLEGVQSYVDSILNQTYEKIEDFVNNKQAQIDNLNSEKANLESQVTNLNEQISAKDVSISELNSTISELTAEIEALTANGATKDEAIVNLQNQLAEMTAERNTLLAEKANLEANLESANALVDELNATIESLENENAEKDDDIAELLNIINSQNSSAQSFQEDVYELIGEDTEELPDQTTPDGDNGGAEVGQPDLDVSSISFTETSVWVGGQTGGQINNGYSKLTLDNSTILYVNNSNNTVIVYDSNGYLLTSASYSSYLKYDGTGIKDNNAGTYVVRWTDVLQ